MTVYLVRHTEPRLPDELRRFVGQTDLPLSPLGLEQARNLVERLKDVDFEAIYSSDLRRCLETAQIIAGPTGRPIQVDPRLREIHTGLWEMLTPDEARRSYPAEYAERERDIVGYRFPGGESFRDLQRRVIAAFHDIVQTGGKKILVVSHRGANRALLCHLLRRPLDELFGIEQGYGCVNLLELSTGAEGQYEARVSMLGPADAPAPPT